MPTSREQRRARNEERKRWTRSRRAETQFARKLRGVAHEISLLAKHLWRTNDPQGSMEQLRAALARYAETLRPWARHVAASMVRDVSRRDEAQWASLSQVMGRSLRAEIQDAPVGNLLRQRLSEAASLITSLPIDAAKRVHKMTLKGIAEGARASEIAKEIYKTGEVTKSRANLIARTEVSRTSSGLVQSRSEHLGSEGYIWRTSGDADVRKEHRKLNGKFIRWSDPPIAGPKGMRYHAGAGPNCRCWCEPVIPEEEDLPSRFRAEAA